MRPLAFAAAVAFLTGCGGGGGSQPAFKDLLPVSGTVARGGQPTSGGVVRFYPDPDSGEFIINSEVGTDGKFTLTTVRATDTKGERKPGVPAGKYKVAYTPPLGDQTAGGSTAPVELPAPVTVTAADANLKVDLPAAKKK